MPLTARVPADAVPDVHKTASRVGSIVHGTHSPMVQSTLVAQFGAAGSPRQRESSGVAAPVRAIILSKHGRFEAHSRRRCGGAVGVGRTIEVGHERTRTDLVGGAAQPGSPVLQHCSRSPCPQMRSSQPLFCCCHTGVMPCSQVSPSRIARRSCTGSRDRRRRIRSDSRHRKRWAVRAPQRTRRCRCSHRSWHIRSSARRCSAGNRRWSRKGRPCRGRLRYHRSDEGPPETPPAEGSSGLHRDTLGRQAIERNRKPGARHVRSGARRAIGTTCRRSTDSRATDSASLAVARATFAHERIANLRALAGAPQRGHGWSVPMPR